VGGRGEGRTLTVTRNSIMGPVPTYIDKQTQKGVWGMKFFHANWNRIVGPWQRVSEGQVLATRVNGRHTNACKG
jgi:hypothetical protein